MPRINWSEYYKGTAGQPPHPLLLTALLYVPNAGKAIDIGAGALNETRYLLEKGFDITVVDQSHQVEQEAKKMGSEKIRAFTSRFEDFTFPKESYDLAVAMFSLPFLKREDFSAVFEKTKSSLKRRGIFCGQFFGDRDERKLATSRTFHTKEQVLELLKDMEVLSFEEEEKIKGEKKWHIFHVVARKR